MMCLRNPVDRAYSDYWMQVRRGFEPLSFEEAIQQESARVDSHYERVYKEPLYWADNLSGHAYLLRGRYQLHLRRWLDTFPRDQILFITIDQMKADPQGVFDQVCEHIGLDAGHEPVFKVHGQHGHTNPKMAPETRKGLSDLMITSTLPPHLSHLSRSSMALWGVWSASLAKSIPVLVIL